MNNQFREWYRTRTRNVELSLWCGALLIALLLCVGIATCGESATQPSQTQNTTSQQATTAPTQQPATPTSISENTAVLGGSVLAFDNKMGANNCCHDNGWDTNTMWVGVYTAEDGSRWYQAVGEQSHERVVGIRLHPYNANINQAGTPVWDMPTAKKTCNAYLPSDAVFQKSYQHISFDIVDGIINEYYSPLLAQTLPSKDFTDANNHPEKPGLFFVYFNYARPGHPGPIDFCTLSTDASLSREDV